MREDELSLSLLMQACETTDAEQRFIPGSDRDRATRQAVRSGGGEPAGDGVAVDEALLARRAERLAESVLEGRPALERLRALASLRFGLPVIALVALVVGMLADTLGSARHINLLSFPLLTLVAWNGAVYLGLALAALGRGGDGASRSTERAVDGLSAVGALLGAPRRMIGRSDDDVSWQTAAGGAFLRLWRARAGALLVARVRAALHLSAAALAVGVVAGMYVQGFAFEYLASWESTFLSAQGVSRLLGVVLGPAALLLGMTLPDAAAMEGLHAPGAGHAAPWIHLWAVTALLFVVAPRCALAAWARLAERRAAAGLAFDLESGYALRILAPARGEGRVAVVQPYSFEPSKRSETALRELLLELFGNRARLRVREPLAYGSSLPEPLAEAPACLVVVFNLAQTPEQEVHGEFIEALKHRVEADAADAQLLVLLDEEAYLVRMGGGEGEADEQEARVHERRRSWERMLRESGVESVAISGQGPSDETLERARRALWEPA